MISCTREQATIRRVELFAGAQGIVVPNTWAFPTVDAGSFPVAPSPKSERPQRITNWYEQAAYIRSQSISRSVQKICAKRRIHLLYDRNFLCNSKYRICVSVSVTYKAIMSMKSLLFTGANPNPVSKSSVSHRWQWYVRSANQLPQSTTICEHSNLEVGDPMFICICDLRACT